MRDAHESKLWKGRGQLVLFNYNNEAVSLIGGSWERWGLNWQGLVRANLPAGSHMEAAN